MTPTHGFKSKLIHGSSLAHCYGSVLPTGGSSVRFRHGEETFFCLLIIVKYLGVWKNMTGDFRI